MRRTRKRRRRKRGRGRLAQGDKTKRHRRWSAFRRYKKRGGPLYQGTIKYRPKRYKRSTKARTPREVGPELLRRIRGGRRK